MLSTANSAVSSYFCVIRNALGGNRKPLIGALPDEPFARKDPERPQQVPRFRYRYGRQRRDRATIFCPGLPVLRLPSGSGGRTGPGRSQLSGGPGHSAERIGFDAGPARLRPRLVPFSAVGCDPWQRCSEQRDRRRFSTPGQCLDGPLAAMATDCQAGRRGESGRCPRARPDGYRRHASDHRSRRARRGGDREHVRRHPVRRGCFTTASACRARSLCRSDA